MYSESGLGKEETVVTWTDTCLAIGTALCRSVQCGMGIPTPVPDHPHLPQEDGVHRDLLEIRRESCIQCELWGG